MSWTNQRPEHIRAADYKDVREMRDRIARRAEMTPDFLVPVGRYLADVDTLIALVDRYHKRTSGRVARMPMKGPQREELIQEILDMRIKKMSYRQIAEITGVHPETVLRTCRRHGLTKEGKQS